MTKPNKKFSLDEHIEKVSAEIENLLQSPDFPDVSIILLLPEIENAIRQAVIESMKILQKKDIDINQHCHNTLCEQHPIQCNYVVQAEGYNKRNKNINQEIDEILSGGNATAP